MIPRQGAPEEPELLVVANDGGILQSSAVVPGQHLTDGTATKHDLGADLGWDIPAHGSPQLRRLAMHLRCAHEGAVQPCASTTLSDGDEPAQRVKDPGGNSDTVAEEGDHHRERLPSGGEVPGAVERVDDPHVARSRHRIHQGRVFGYRFLAHHRGAWQERKQPFGEQLLGLAIRHGDDVTRALLENLFCGKEAISGENRLPRHLPHQRLDRLDHELEANVPAWQAEKASSARNSGARHAMAASIINVTEVVPTYPQAPAPRLEDLLAYTEGWLRNRRLSEHTRSAYRRDARAWLEWCRRQELDPLAATFVHVNAYARELESTMDGRTGKLYTPATVARKLSGLSSWYDFLVKLGVVATNPVAGADRPRVARDHSATVGLTAEEVDALLAAAEADTGPARERNHAVIALLADLGLRVGELVGLNVSDLGYERGHRSIRFAGKGGVQRRRALTPASAAALERYLMQRAAREGVSVDQLDGPLFVTASGARLDRHAVFRLVRRLAAVAGIPAANRLSPHSLRHAFATAARNEGVPLEDVQDAMGHADPRTTRRYDRDRHNLDRDPSYVLYAARARRRAAR